MTTSMHTHTASVSTKLLYAAQAVVELWTSLISGISNPMLIQNTDYIVSLGRTCTHHTPIAPSSHIALINLVPDCLQLGGRWFLMMIVGLVTFSINIPEYFFH